MYLLLGYSPINLKIHIAYKSPFKMKSSRHQSMVQSLNIALVCLRKLNTGILAVDCDDTIKKMKRKY